MNNQKEKAKEIRDFYVEKSPSAFDELLELHERVKKPAVAISVIVGAIGTLVMGLGMANVMAWSRLAIGIFLGILGIALMGVAYPINEYIMKIRKKKYANEIIHLSNKIIDK